MSTTNDNPLYEELLKDYDTKLDHSGINGKRIAKRLVELSQIGFVQVGGVKRPGFSNEEKEAKVLVKKWMAEAGLTVSEDGAGNVTARLEGKNNHPAIASGSHVDSVPNGGNFDGPLGVLSALEVAESWKEEGYIPQKPYEVIIFSDEEGSRFNSGLTGSQAMTGTISEEEMAQLRDYNGDTLEQVLTHYGSTLEAFKAAGRDLAELELFVEVHIEQGKKLEIVNQPVGIVSGIAGPAWLAVEFAGEAGHAGNTPMIGRKDCLIAAAEFIQSIPQFPKTVSETAVATVGKMDVFPNGANVIPEKVKLLVDIRDINEAPRDQLIDQLIEQAEKVAAKNDIHVTVKLNTRIQPVPIAKDLQKRLAISLNKFGISPTYIPSGAGHDAMNLGRFIPVAMLFVRSKGGISHNPKEWSSLNDCVMGIHVLKDFIQDAMKK
ncbi:MULTISPECIES: M20 family metallo-hydrolase [Planococcus]|uniref:Allantoate amidohydrolase n=1 Tax=Planococcus faecalis TaxID=1598147 RepID=A0ABM6IUP1_9BACL|nr:MULTISPECIES: M20 family metallo-hydrolase [Planococcus]AQU80086.1 allantoate amidohydrolase [Planococcus faecalis]MDJ0330540.1 M20 family metallo-hydrolase [Planococcus sp. S3-L1]OHX52539.1 Zn-dependent hydrolase [Planococcus faecalis]